MGSGRHASTISGHIAWIDWTEELTDVADTAALIAGLDMVISIDSAMVNLADALLQPVLMLNCFDSEWRWFQGHSSKVTAPRSQQQSRVSGDAHFQPPVVR